MFSSVHVQFTKCCPLPSPFMNTRVQFMFSSRKKYVNTKRSFGPLSCCLRVLGPIWDLTCAARDAALLLRCNHVGRVILSSSSSRLLRSDPSRSWQPTFLGPCDPLDVPIDQTKICIVHPFHTHVVIYGDPDVEAPTLCICNEAAVPGGLLPSKTLFSIRWSHGMIRMIEPTNRSIQDALVYTAFMARWHLDKPPQPCSCGGMCLRCR